MDNTAEAARGADRPSLAAAHFGLVLVLLAGLVLGYFVSPIVGAATVGVFVALFLLVLVVQLTRGRTAPRAARGAYRAAFAWITYLP